LHGFRKAHTTAKKFSGAEDSGERDFETCGPNEVWSFGEEAYKILNKYLFLREKLRPYIMKQMLLAHKKGTPPMRPLFYDFPDDETSWDIEDEFMFGPDILVAPVLFKGARSRMVYLPEGAQWKEVSTGRSYGGGQFVECEAPLETIPLFTRNDAVLPIY